MPDYQKGLAFAFISAILAAGFMIPWKLAAGLGSTADMVLILVTSAALINTLTLGFQQGWRGIIAPPSKLELILSLVFAIFTVAGNQASAEAINYLSPAVVTTIMRVEVIFIALLAWLLIKEMMNIRFWIAIGVVSLGFYIMQPPLDISGEWQQGALYAASASFIFAVMAVITRKYIHRIDPTRVNSLRLWFSVLLWMPIYRDIPQFESWTSEFVLLVSFAALLGPGMGRLLVMYSAKYVEARTAAMVISSSPALALVLGIVFLDDYPGVYEILGGLMMMSGIALSLTARKKPASTIADSSEIAMSPQASR
ncbi:DMT family transporter [Pseudobacteriovorax antillogorgiicola]|uniref:Permease of the drug/metabolite transporter (DMT) superfamily n=1 Tax=Pseudobacteriovorax antillogorgiicola TaxID=1513793 RepID=A0A1Y6CCC7_9BACT|nr:DMT family transporter [Pseudobacteriovorax antillogorgiicola]TCS48311.1 drug/metabolite transporter (DMT)-like permease [Pseudobacteriovorax antillogorgiicola]SMF56674.1 Permease of the drug/metabolite transporter (DMT) superfamily [Pseudobacteriovorax antillogorgiicola]